jgi:hypothetical protein
MWQTGGAKLDLTTSAFQNYLRERTGSVDAWPANAPPPRVSVWARRKPSEKEPEIVNKEDLAILYGAAEEVARYLAHPALLIKALS